MKKKLIVCIMSLIIIFIMVEVIFAENKKLQATKEQVSKACMENDGIEWNTEGNQGGGYGCITDEGWIDCNENGDCTGGRAENIQNVSSPKYFKETAKEMEIVCESFNKVLDNLNFNEKTMSQILALDRKTDRIIKEGHALVKKNNLKRIGTKAEAIRIHNRLLQISGEIQQNLKIRQDLQNSKTIETAGPASAMTSMHWLTKGQLQFKADCEQSGGTYHSSSGLGKCCWQNWGCLQCSLTNCVMDCDTQECKDAQLLSPSLFREAAKEMELSRESSHNFLNRLIGYKAMKDQSFALDRENDKIIKEGQILINNTESKCFRSKEEVMKTHSRLLEIASEINQNIRKQQMILIDLQKELEGKSVNN